MCVCACLPLSLFRRECGGGGATHLYDFVPFPICPLRRIAKALFAACFSCTQAFLEPVNARERPAAPLSVRRPPLARRASLLLFSKSIKNHQNNSDLSSCRVFDGLVIPEVEMCGHT